MTVRSLAGALLILLVPSLGCHVGRRAESFRPATNPGGVVVELQLERGDVSGELLAVEDDGLLFAIGDRVVRVPYAEIRRGEAHDMPGSTHISEGRAPSAVARRELALVSRYPQGLTPALLDRILAAYEQAEIETWGR